MLYEVQMAYEATDRFGPWKSGDIVDIQDPEDVAWLERDMPGLLVEVKDQDSVAFTSVVPLKSRRERDQMRGVGGGGGAMSRGGGLDSTTDTR